MAARLVDLTKLGIFKNALEAITDEAALTIVRTARSLTTKESMDFSTALFDARGEQIAQGLCLPFQVGALPEFMPTILKEFGGQMSPGDVYLSNDPYLGGTHLPDFLLFKPIFLAGRLTGFAAVLAHMTDIGGRVPGGTSADSSEIYQEGLRLPPVKLFSGGVRNDWVFRLISANVRVADDIIGDVEALLAALDRSEKSFQELCRDFKPADLDAWTSSLLDYSELMTRQEISSIPDGRYEFTDFVDSDAATGEPIRLHCVVIIDGDGATVDLSGSSAQVPSALNLLPSTAKAAIYTAFHCAFEQDVPSNAGYFRPIKVVLPANSIVNPDLPAACAARGVVAFRLYDALMGCLAQALPDRIPAAGEGGISFLTLGGASSSRSPFVFVDVLSASWGGRPDCDGIEGVSPPGANIRITSAEVVEAQFPLRIERREFIEGTGGIGKFRGGLGYRYDVRLLAPVAVVSVRCDRSRFRPWGLQGGGEGSQARCVLNPGSAGQKDLPLLFTGRMLQGDVIRLELPGGGGFGAAFERDPNAVLTDVVHGKITADTALRDYGVVILDSPPAVDVAATSTIRQQHAMGTDITARPTHPSI